MKKYIYILIAAISLAGSSKVFADFDFVIFGNVSGNNHLHGSTYVDGSVLASGTTEFGDGYDGTSNNGNSLVIRGDYNPSWEKVLKGNVLYGGSEYANDVDNTTGRSQDGQNYFTKAASVEIDSYGINQSNFQALSEYYSTSSTSSLSSMIGIDLSGNAGVGVNYYSMTEEVFKGIGVTGNTSVFISDSDVDNNDIYIINVAGTNISWGGLNFNGIDSSLEGRIIWNFYEAETLNLTGAFYGTVLAADANLSYGNNIYGNVVVNNLYGNGEVYAKGSYFPEVPAVPAPSALLLSSMGLVFGKRVMRK